MKKLALVLSLVAASASARTLWFEPPNPDSHTRVVAHIQAKLVCPPSTVTVTQTSGGFAIDVSEGPLVCPPDAPPPDGYPVTADLGVLSPGVYDVVVGYNKLLVAVADEKLVVSDAESPVVIQPNTGHGGELVTVKAPGIAPQCIVAPCDTPVVTFDDKQAELVQTIDTGTVVVRTPPHDPGAVDVNITTGPNTWRRKAAFDYLSTSPDAAFFERVLFPVMVSGPGAFGSLWKSEAALHNGNAFPFTDFDSLFRIICFPICDTRPQPDSTIILQGQNAAEGIVAFPARQSMPGANFSLLVRDQSREANDFGTSIPVIREHGFSDRAFAIVNVPADSRYRVALRLYAYYGEPQLGVKIVSIGAEPGKTLIDTSLQLHTTSSGTHSFAYVGDLLTAYPQLVGKGPLTITISGVTAEKPAWGFVSITNNETQHVTVVAPE